MLFGSRILTKTSVICNAVFIVVILASLAVVLVDSLQSVKDDATTANILNYVELAFSILFTAEYFVRLVCVRQCVLYMISFMGIVDFLSAVPPLFALLFSPLSTLILLRVLKLTRIFTLFESVGVFRAYHEMLRNVNQNTLKMVVFIVGFWSISVVLGGFMFVLESAENPGFDNMFKAVYWAVVTLTTVGYGDAVPETPAGKVSVMFVLFESCGAACLSLCIWMNSLTGLPTVIKTLQCFENTGAGCDYDDHGLYFCCARSAPVLRFVEALSAICGHQFGPQ